MKVCDYIEKCYVDDNTEIYIVNEDKKLLAHGKWYEDKILSYLDKEVKSSHDTKDTKRIALCIK